MSSQPANAAISIFRRVRVQSSDDRHDAVKVLGHLRPKYVVVPSEEVSIADTKDGVISDAWRYGHPVVRYVRQTKSLASVYASVPGLQFPVRITNDRRDIHIEKVEGNVTDDLFGEVANA